MRVFKSEKGYALVILLFILVLVGYLVMRLINGDTGVSSGAKASRVSQPQATINKAKEAVEKANKRQEANENAAKEFGY